MEIKGNAQGGENGRIVTDKGKNKLFFYDDCIIMISVKSMADLWKQRNGTGNITAW